MRPHQGFSRRSLQECFGFAIDWPMQEIVARGVANIQTNGRIEICYGNKIRRAKVARLFWRPGPAAGHQKEERKQE